MVSTGVGRDHPRDAYAEVCLVIACRAARLLETVRAAADDAGEVAELWDTLQRNRHAGAAMVVRRVEELGGLAPGLDAGTATDMLWIFNDPAQYAALVLGRGWTERAFRRWLAGCMRHALLDPSFPDGAPLRG